MEGSEDVLSWEGCRRRQLCCGRLGDDTPEGAEGERGEERRHFGGWEGGNAKSLVGMERVSGGELRMR